MIDIRMAAQLLNFGARIGDGPANGAAQGGCRYP